VCLPPSLPAPTVDESARTVTGAIVPTFTERIVTDDISITSATWDPAGTLTVAASSSCGVGLTLVGYGPLARGSISASHVGAAGSSPGGLTALGQRDALGQNRCRRRT
jgi:hypothetical protein